MEENKNNIIEFQYYPFILWKMGRRHIKYIINRLGIKIINAPTKKDGIISTTISGTTDEINYLKIIVERKDFKNFVKYLENDMDYLIRISTRIPKKEMINYIIRNNKYDALKNMLTIYKIQLNNDHKIYAMKNNAFASYKLLYNHITKYTQNHYKNILYNYYKQKYKVNIEDMSHKNLAKYINNCIIEKEKINLNIIIFDSFIDYAIKENEWRIIQFIHKNNLYKFQSHDIQMATLNKSYNVKKYLQSICIELEYYDTSDSNY